MTVTRIWLVRHGETHLNTRSEAFTGWNEDPLTKLGEKQAQLTAARLKGEPIKYACSSALSRARQTARIIAAPHSLEVQPCDALNEVDYGEWVGKTRPEIKSEYPEIYDHWVTEAEFIKIPGGETFAEVAHRAMAELERIAEEAAGQTALVVAHKSTNRIVLCRILGLSVSNYLQIGQDNCALNLLIYQQGTWIVECINDHQHLAGL